MINLLAIFLFLASFNQQNNNQVSLSIGLCSGSDLFQGLYLLICICYLTKMLQCDCDYDGVWRENKRLSYLFLIVSNIHFFFSKFLRHVLFAGIRDGLYVFFFCCLLISLHGFRSTSFHFVSNRKILNRIEMKRNVGTVCRKIRRKIRIKSTK